MNQELFSILLRKNSKATEKKFLSTCAGSRIIKNIPRFLFLIYLIFIFYLQIRPEAGGHTIES